MLRVLELEGFAISRMVTARCDLVGDPTLPDLKAKVGASSWKVAGAGNQGRCRCVTIAESWDLKGKLALHTVKSKVRPGLKQYGAGI